MGLKVEPKIDVGRPELSVCDLTCEQLLTMVVYHRLRKRARCRCGPSRRLKSMCVRLERELGELKLPCDCIESLDKIADRIDCILGAKACAPFDPCLTGHMVKEMISATDSDETFWPPEDEEEEEG